MQAQITLQPLSIDICNGSNGRLICKGNNLTTYRWQDSSSSGWVNLSQNTTYSGVTKDTLTLTKPSSSLNSRRYRCILDSNGLGIRRDTSRSVSAIVLSALSKASISGNKSICYNSSADTIKMTTNASGGKNGFSYQWQKSSNGTSWSNISGATGTNYLPGNLTSSQYYRISANSNFTCGIINSDSVLVNVYPILNPGSIANNQTICYNTVPKAIKISTTPSGGGGGFSYQWQSSTDSINFSNISGATLDSLQLGSLSTKTFVRVLVNSSKACGPIPSNILRILVRGNLTAPRLLGNDTICYNTSPDTLKIVQAPRGGDGTYAYQWQKSNNGINWSDILNETKSKHKTGALTSNTFYRLKTTTGSNCGSVYSDSIFVKVYANLTAATIGDKQSICYNSSLKTLKTKTAATGGGDTYNYQWQISTDSLNFSNISNANNDSLKMNNLKVNSFYRMLVNSTKACGQTISNSTKVTVYKKLSAAITIGNDTVCYNTSADTLRMTNYASGGDGQFALQWQSSADGLSWIDLLNETNSKYKSPALKSNTFYRLKSIAGSNCGNVYSDSLFVKVYADLAPAAINQDQTICYNTAPQTLKTISFAKGGNDKFSNQWLISSDSINFSSLTGQTKDSLATGKLNATKYYKLNSISNFGCGQIESKRVKITVYDIFNGPKIKSSDTICFGALADTLTITQAASGGNKQYFYQWQKSSNSITWQSISTQTNVKYGPGNLNASQYYKLISNSGMGCGFDTSNIVYLRVLPQLNAAAIFGNQNICYGAKADTVKPFTLASGGNGLFTYNWQTSLNASTWTNSGSSSPTFYNNGNLNNSIFNRLKASSNYACGDVYSNVIFINVYPKLNSGIIDADQVICYNSKPNNLRSLTGPFGGGNSYAYNWQLSLDSLNFLPITGETLNSISPAKLVKTAFYRLKTSSTLGCGYVESNIIKIKVYDKLSIGKLLGNDTICARTSPNLFSMSRPVLGGDLNYTYQWYKSINNINWSIISNSTQKDFQESKLNSNFFYKLHVTSGSACGIDTSNSIFVKVNPLPDSIPINGKVILCRNSKDVPFKLQYNKPEYTYKWDLKSGDIIYGQWKDSCYVNLSDNKTKDTIKVFITNKFTSCQITTIKPIEIIESRAPNKTKIVRKANSNILVCEDNDPNITYQWGFIERSTLKTTAIPSSNNRYIVLPHNFDTTQYIYFVETAQVGCKTRSYYNYSLYNENLELNTFAINELIIYPNPSNGKFTLNTSESIDEIKIYNMMGQEMKINQIENSNSFMASCPAGIYTVWIKINQSVTVKQITIQ